MSGPSPPDRFDVSVVVPTSNTSEFLPTCLGSVLNQTHVAVQVIVVDDASTDGTADLAERILDGVPGSSVLRTPTPEGPGAARNLGFLQASGRWTLFVDSDDFLVPNVLADLVDQADRSAADFLLFDYSRAMPSGEAIRNARAPSIAAVDGRVVRAEEALDLLEILPVVWNKLFRTSWFRELGMQFPPGIYEDMPVTYRAFVEAQRIVAYDRSCYFYRRRPEADSALARIDRRHFDVLEQWDRVAELAAASPDVLRRALFDRMVDHAVYTLEQRIVRLSDNDFDEFFHALARRFVALRPLGVDVGGLKIGGVRARAIASGSPDLYRRLILALKVRRKMRSLPSSTLRPRRIAGGVRRRWEAADHHVQVHRSPVHDDLAVFMSSWNRYPAGNPRAISSALSQERPDLRQLWIVDDRHGAADAAVAGFDVVPAGSCAHHRALAQARWFVSDVNFPDYLERRSGQVHLQTKHGTPLKTMGFDLRSFPQSARGMNFERLGARAARWDYVISSNPFSTNVWRRVFPFDYEVLEIGYPRNDRLVLATAEDRREARRTLGLHDEPVILYAPTLRDYVSPEPLRIDPERLLADLDRLTGRSAVLLVRGHYLRGAFGSSVTNERVIDVSGHRDLESLMIAADVLVTDYSSVMFDFALLDRPIVLYIDDWEEYQRSRGTYLDIRDEGPGGVAVTQDQLVRSLARAVAADGPSEQQRAFRRRFCPWDDGHASERAVAAVFGA